jgi:serine O-acetyltransferase
VNYLIESRKDLFDYIESDNSFAKEKGRQRIMKRVHDTEYYIDKYLVYLRKQEYYINTAGSNIIKRFLSLYYERKKHNLGNKLGFYIGPNCFDKGLTIYHHGSIIVNPIAKIGENCKLHGNNCIGNSGLTETCPMIGNNVDIGFGAVIIGDVQIADNIKIGANAVVNKSFLDPGITIAGVPARKVK